VARGYQVTSLVLYNSFNHWGWLEDIDCKDQINVVCGDIRDPHFCKQIVRDQDVIFHLAALIAIPYSYVAPDSYVGVNVLGTLNICQAARESGVKRVLHTSTSEVYGTAQYVPIDEKHPLQPQSPYSASKIGAEAMAMSFYNAFGLPVTVVRPFNTYGPRQSARAVIPSIITQIAAGREVKLGDLSPTRDFNFVADTCHGFVLLAECDAAIGKTVNIGSGTEISVADTLDAIISDRPYRLGRQLAEARTEISRMAGVQFDPGIVPCACALYGVRTACGSTTSFALTPSCITVTADFMPLMPPINPDASPSNSAPTVGLLLS